VILSFGIAIFTSTSRSISDRYTTVSVSEGFLNFSAFIYNASGLTHVSVRGL
jgi:hypothetical protein